MVLLSVVLVAAHWMWSASTAGAVHLPLASVETVIGSFVVAVAAFLTGAILASAPRRYGVIEFETSLPTARSTQAFAQDVGFIGLGCLVVGLGFFRLLLLHGTGTIMVSEVVAAGLLVVVAGLLGLVLGDRTTSFAAPVLALLVLAGIGFVGYLGGGRLGTWTVSAGIDPFMWPPLPESVMARAGWGRVAWLAALSIALGLVRMVDGLDRPVRSGARIRLLVVAAVVAALGAAALQADLATHTADQQRDREQLRQQPAGYWHCEMRADVRYCPMEGFSSMIPEWATVVAGVQRQVPVKRSLGVYQAVSGWADPVDGRALPVPVQQWRKHTDPGRVSVAVSTRWAEPGEDDFGQTEVFGFAADVAYSMITGGSAIRGANVSECGGRGAVHLFIARSATPATESAYQVQLSRSSGVFTEAASMQSAAGFSFGPRATQLADRLMALPRGRVQAVLKRDWASVTGVDSSVDEVAQKFGVQAPAAGLDRGTMCAAP
ncbi:hypothetical protein ACMYYO_10945 [Dermacoccaceae bacterium W4C1]